MLQMSGALDRKNREFLEKYTDIKPLKNSRKSTTNKTDPQCTEKLTETEWKDFRQEILILRFLHQLYAECAGYQRHMIQAKQAATRAKTSSGADLVESSGQSSKMRLEDIRELFCCCSGSADDEVKIDAALHVTLQVRRQLRGSRGVQVR